MLIIAHQSIIRSIHMQMLDPYCWQFDRDISKDADDYNWIRILRIVIIGISVTALLINIVVIIKKKQYKFNTIRLFLFVQIFYVPSLLSVTPHNTSFNLNQSAKPEGSFGHYMQCFVTSGIQYKCAVQGFINLACYSISYWFAVCITLYIRLVLENNHKRFMKKKGLLIFSVIIVVFIWYLIPFIFTFIENMPFSFGPTGYKYKNTLYLLYSGIVARQDSPAVIFLVTFWMLFLPISMFIYHISLLWGNQKYINKLKELDEINPRQYFLIKSGKISMVIFVVQILNVVKLGLGFWADEGSSETIVWIVFIMNVIFDLLALLLIWIYFRYYYKQGRKLQEDSEIMNNSLAQSFSTLTSSII